MDEDQETESCPDYPNKDNAGEKKPVDVTKGRLYIKLKFPTAGNRSNGEDTGMHGDEQLENSQTNKDHVCNFCNKRFSSGKGLGGHKRVHTQASKRPHQFLHKKIHKPKFKKSGVDDERYHSNAKKDDTDATCVMCGKTFPSMKSLFGHMRSHPDREWRGIHPPGRSNRSMPVSIEESAGPCWVHDRATTDPDDTSQISSPADNALPGSTSEWRVTGKRRNNLRSVSSGGADFSGLPSSPALSDWVSTEVELEASDNLLLLAKGNHALSNSLSTSDPGGKLARGSNCNAEELIKSKYDHKTQVCPELVEVSKKQELESSPPDKTVKKESPLADGAYTTTVREGKGKGKMDEFQDCDDDEDDDDDDDDAEEEEDHDVDDGDDDKGYSHEKSVEAESNCEDGEYKVTQYQLELNILVEKGNIEKKKRKPLPRNSEAGTDGIAWCISHSRNISKIPERYKCNICNKSFLTFQALGGHMSSHSKATIKKSQSADDQEGSASADQEADEFRSSAIITAASKEAKNDGGTEAECCGDSGDGTPSVQASGHKMLVFDLNELPPTEEEDEQER